MPLRSFTTSAEGRASPGSAGIAQALGWTSRSSGHLRALALAGGAGIVLISRSGPGRRRSPALAFVLLLGAGLACSVRWESPTAACGDRARRPGLALALRQGEASGRRTALVRRHRARGFRTILLLQNEAHPRAARPGAVAGALVSCAGRCCGGLRSSAMPTLRAHPHGRARRRGCAFHDSVLQTLALIQRHAGERVARHARAAPGARAARLALRSAAARRRRFLPGRGLSAAADVEELHGVRIELASAVTRRRRRRSSRARER